MTNVPDRISATFCDVKKRLNAIKTSQIQWQKRRCRWRR